MNTGTRIKICGITNHSDREAAIEAGADALGFIFVPGTPRYIGGSGAEELLNAVPPFVERVGVCDGLSGAARLRGMGIDTLQVYHLPPPGEGEWRSALPSGRRILPAFRLKNREDFKWIAAALKQMLPPALLLDAYHPQQLGGSGIALDWDLAREAKERFGLPLVLAGGLTPENVAQAVASVQPYAVDVSSGVEHTPGQKDHAKLRAFVAAVRG